MLTNEELCRLAQNGDAEAREKLLRDNMNFYAEIARTIWDKNPKFYRALNIEVEDLLQEGLIKLNHGIDRYQFDRNANFLTYIHRVLHNAMIDYVRRELSSRKSLIQKNTDDEKTSHMRARSHPQFMPSVDTVIQTELRQTLADAWHNLPERQKIFLRYRFGLDESNKIQTNKDTAKHFSLTERRCKHEEKKAIQLLRQEYANQSKYRKDNPTHCPETDRKPAEEDKSEIFLEPDYDYEDIHQEEPSDPVEQLRRELEGTELFPLDESFGNL